MNVEIGNERGRAVSFLGIFVSNIRYSVRVMSPKYCIGCNSYNSVVFLYVFGEEFSVQCICRAVNVQSAKTMDK